MPILPPETHAHPASLFDDSVAAPPGNKWWVIHTRPRAEKALVRRLLQEDIAFFLPLYHRCYKSGGRKLSSYLPLFPGYVFLRGDEDARVQTLTTNMVANCLPVVDQAGLWSDLRKVYRLMGSELPLSPEDQLQPGTRVEITSGILAGLEGKVLRRGAQFRFVSEVRLLQRGVSIEVDSWMFKTI
jgi:transcriptional antiterminator RfaH